jgi:hypothetical protein
MNFKIRNTIIDAYKVDLIKLFDDQLIDVCFSGSFEYNLNTELSDIDINIGVKDLKTITRNLDLIKFEYDFKKCNFHNEIWGIRDYISIDHRRISNTLVQIHIEETSIKYQHLPVHTKFLKKYFQENPIEYKRIRNLKIKGENKIKGGYRKAHILIFEEQMRRDLGYCPERIERSDFGFKYPEWKGKITPFDWIFLREVYGVEDGKKIIDQV